MAEKNISENGVLLSTALMQILYYVRTEENLKSFMDEWNTKDYEEVIEFLKETLHFLNEMHTSQKRIEEITKRWKKKGLI